jgi:DNA-binding beta-propeller fold protein YncE
MWGDSGVEDGQLNQPAVIAFDSEGLLYVTDSGNHRVQVFDNNGNFITKWGSKGSGDGDFSKPESIEVDPNGKVYVADTSNNDVQTFVPENGNLLF